MRILVTISSESNVADRLARVVDCLQVVEREIARVGATAAPEIEISRQRWQDVLPGWFMASLREDESQDEADAYLTAWRQASAEARRSMEAARRWSLDDWMYWMAPHRRTWSWAVSRLRPDGGAEIEIDVVDWPCAIGALAFLLRASGLAPQFPD